MAMLFLLFLQKPRCLFLFSKVLFNRFISLLCDLFLFSDEFNLGFLASLAYKLLALRLRLAF